MNTYVVRVHHGEPETGVPRGALRRYGRKQSLCDINQETTAANVGRPTNENEYVRVLE